MEFDVSHGLKGLEQLFGALNYGLEVVITDKCGSHRHLTIKEISGMTVKNLQEIIDSDRIKITAKHSFDNK